LHAATPTETNARRVDGAVITALALVAWAAIVAAGRAWGMYLEARGTKLVLFTPPILGGYRETVGASFLIPVLVAPPLVVGLPRATARLRWSGALVTTAGGALLWWLALALVDGRDGLTDGLHWDADLGGILPGVAAHPGGFLSRFVEDVPGYSIQVRAHPPGLPLLLAALDRFGLGGPGWAATVTLASAVSAVVAVLVTVRCVAGEATARRAAPFIALAPAAVWIATSFDAMYAGPAAWFVALFALATRAEGRRRDLLAVGAALLAAASVMLSYGLVLMGAVVLFIALRRRAWRVVAVSSTAAIVGVLAFVPFGFWWYDGLQATRVEYFALGVERPYLYFIFNNLAAFALVLGPATFVALALLRDRALWAVAGGGLLAVALADLSGLSNGEVERIWLPFTIWVLTAGAVLGARRSAGSLWLALQAASAVILVSLIRPVW